MSHVEIKICTLGPYQNYAAKSKWGQYVINQIMLSWPLGGGQDVPSTLARNINGPVPGPNVH